MAEILTPWRSPGRTFFSTVLPCRLLRPAGDTGFRRRLSPSILVLIYVAGFWRYAESQPENTSFFPPRLDSLVTIAVDEAIVQKYDSAMAHVAEMERLYPKSPVGPFFHSAVLHSIMLDYEDYDRVKEFKQAVDRTIALAGSALRQNPHNAWAHFFLGGGYAYLAFYYGKHGHYVHAFSTGLRAISALQHALDADSTIYDAYLGIGTYKYYRSKYAGFLTRLPFVKDEREEGIRMVRLAAEKGKFSKYPAINNLAWILASEERYEEANRVARRALDAYPESRFFLWTVAATSRLSGDWGDALKQYQHLMASFRQENRLTPYNELVIRTRTAECYAKVGQWSKSEEQRKLATAIHLSKDEKRRAEKHLEKLEELTEAEQARLSRSTSSSSDTPDR